jgi:hypothetical protein
MASLSKRLSVSSTHSGRSASPVSIRFAAAPNVESEEWLRVWESTTAQGAHQQIRSILHRASLRGLSLTPKFSNSQPLSKAQWSRSMVISR